MYERIYQFDSLQSEFIVATRVDSIDGWLSKIMTGKTILIVDDERDIRETLQEILEMEGFQTLVAANGKEALERLRLVERPCLILLDMMMPVVNGWEFLAEREKDESLARIPVVVVTATGKKMVPAQIDEYIKKPVELDELMLVVKKYCS